MGSVSVSDADTVSGVWPVIGREFCPSRGVCARPGPLRRRYDVKKHEMIMTKDKETRNTMRYVSDPTQGPPAMRTVYIERWALGDPVPERVKVTVESADGD